MGEWPYLNRSGGREPSSISLFLMAHFGPGQPDSLWFRELWEDVKIPVVS